MYLKERRAEMREQWNTLAWKQKAMPLGRGNWKEEGDGEEGKGRQWERETNQNRIE